MEKYLLIFVMTLPFSLFSMDIELQNCGKQEKLKVTEANVETIAIAIDKAINDQHPQTIGSFFIGKTEDDHINILRVPQTYSPPIKINNLLIEKLISKNIKFSDALAYFSNIKNVNCNTLQLMESNPEDLQIPKCHKLSKAIRSYILKSAQISIRNLKFRYEIILENKHRYPITLHSICPQKNLAATYDNISGEIELWNLTTRKHFNLTRNQHITALYFSPLTVGPLLFVGQTQKKIGSIIRIWNVESKKQVAEFTCCRNTEYIIEDFLFSEPKLDVPLTLMSVLIKNKNVGALIKQWIITPDKYLFSDLIIPVNTSYSFGHQIRQGFYEINNSEYFRSHSQLGIFKYNCHDFYLCQQAAKTMISKQDAQKITSSQSYKNLIKGGYEYEKSVIDKQIQEKTK